MKFEKVSYEEFWKALERFPLVAAEQLAMAEQIYRRIKIPDRKTVGSAGYDFSVPFTLSIGPGRTAYIPSGIKCYFSEQESESWHLDRRSQRAGSWCWSMGRESLIQTITAIRTTKATSSCR